MCWRPRCVRVELTGERGIKTIPRFMKDVNSGNNDNLDDSNRNRNSDNQ